MYKLIFHSWLSLIGTLFLFSALLTPKVVLSQSPVDIDNSVSTPQQVDNSGIKGIVTIGPISPVERIGVINYRPYQATITVLDQLGQTVTQFQSNENGYFRVSLEPGVYTLRPESPGFYPRAPLQTITVSENKFTQVRISYDSGIR